MIINNEMLFIYIIDIVLGWLTIRPPLDGAGVEREKFMELSARRCQLSRRRRRLLTVRLAITFDLTNEVAIHLTAIQFNISFWRQKNKQMIPAWLRERRVKVNAIS